MNFNDRNEYNQYCLNLQEKDADDVEKKSGNDNCNKSAHESLTSPITTLESNKKENLEESQNKKLLGMNEDARSVSTNKGDINNKNQSIYYDDNCKGFKMIPTKDY